MNIKNQTLNRMAIWCLGGILTGCFGPAQAEDLVTEGPIALELLVEADEGKWRLVLLDTIRQAPPGRLVMVSVLFRVPQEPGPDPQMLTLAVPDWLDYQLGSAVGPGSQTLLSFNNGLSFGTDPGLESSADYAGARASHIRWIFTRRMSPGAQAQVRYRGIRRPDSEADNAEEPTEDASAQRGSAN
ncbi:MAG: hypothetical protein OEM03_09060 [Chromatiales bacterium]|nr:hypothetical protein [Chromatiales bacterium]